MAAVFTVWERFHKPTSRHSPCFSVYLICEYPACPFQPFASDPVQDLICDWFSIFADDYMTQIRPSSTGSTQSMSRWGSSEPPCLRGRERPGSLLTPRWSKVDSNPRSHVLSKRDAGTISCALGRWCDGWCGAPFRVRSVHSGTGSSNPLCSSNQSVSAVNPEAIGEKPRTLAGVCGWLGT